VERRIYQWIICNTESTSCENRWWTTFSFPPWIWSVPIIRLKPCLFLHYTSDIPVGLNSMIPLLQTTQLHTCSKSTTEAILATIYVQIQTPNNVSYLFYPIYNVVFSLWWFCIMLSRLFYCQQPYMIPREEVELDDVTSYNIFDNKIYKISSSSL
jgi:hypothetical protein